MSNPVIKHQKELTIPDGADTTVARPSDWNADHAITQNTGRMLGRVAPGSGPTQELTAEQSRTVMGLGTAALVNVGASEGNVPAVQGDGKLPAAVLPDVATFPSGGIVMWSGSVAAIPSGWFLCDGTNGTPNLIDRFIVGAGGAYNPGDTGGADSVTLTTAQIPAHNHTGSTNSTGSHGHGLSTHLNTGSTGGRVSDSSGGFTGTASTNAAGAHAHTLSINNTGGGEGHENRPPYYALCFIMKG